LLGALGEGEASAGEQLLPLVYDELRRLAQSRMGREPAGHTLQATALVHEAYLRLVGNQDLRWQSRAHFFGAAALAMRRILVERARRVRRERHGGGRARLPLEDVDAALDPESLDLAALDEALKDLETIDERMAQVVSLRFFAGLNVEETAAALDISPRTVKREWSVAKVWLYRKMTGEHGEPG